MPFLKSLNKNYKVLPTANGASLNVKYLVENTIQKSVRNTTLPVMQNMIIDVNFKI